MEAHGTGKLVSLLCSRLLFGFLIFTQDLEHSENLISASLQILPYTDSATQRERWSSTNFIEWKKLCHNWWVEKFRHCLKRSVRFSFVIKKFAPCFYYRLSTCGIIDGRKKRPGFVLTIRVNRANSKLILTTKLTTIIDRKPSLAFRKRKSFPVWRVANRESPMVSCQRWVAWQVRQSTLCR